MRAGHDARRGRSGAAEHTKRVIPGAALRWAPAVHAPDRPRPSRCGIDCGIVLESRHPLLVSRWRTALYVLATGLLAGCSSAPPVRIETPYGPVRAASRPQALMVAALTTGLTPRVRSLLPDCREAPTEIWLDDFLADEELAARPDVVGLTELGPNRIRIRADRLGRDADFVLAHELVHALLGDDWAPLPAMLKEGMCDSVASRLAADSAERVRAVRLLDASFSDPGMALEIWFSDPGSATRARLPIPLTAAERLDPLVALGLAGDGLHTHASRQDEPALYGYGLLLSDRIVERIGFDGLHELCLRADAAGHEVVPVDWLLAAAELDGSPATWRAALLAGLQAPALGAQMDLLAAEITDFVLVSFRHRYPGYSGADFLDHSLPTLGWQGSEARVAVAMVDGLRSAILEGWERTGPRPMGPGDSLWLRDAGGAHLTSLLPPEGTESFHTVSRLRVDAGPDDFQSGASGLPLFPSEKAEVEAWIQIGCDGNGVWIRSQHPTGLDTFRVTLDGVVLSDLARNQNADVAQAADGWWSVSCRLPGGLTLDGMLLYGRDANLLIVQRAAVDGAPELQFPLDVTRQFSERMVADTDPSQVGPRIFTAGR